MASNRIYIQIDLNAQSAQQTVNTFNQTLASMGPTVQKSAQQAQQGFTTVGVTIEQATRKLTGFVTTLAGIGLTAAIQQWFQLGSTVMRAETAFTDMFQSAAQAKQFTSDIQDLAARTGANMDELIRDTQKLSAIGLQPRQIEQFFQGIADASARSGADVTEAFTKASTAITTMLGRDSVTKREVAKTFSEMGVSVMKALEEVTGETAQQLSKDMKLLDPKETLLLIIQVLGRYKGALDKAAETNPLYKLNQMIGQLKKSFTDLFQDVAPLLIKLFQQVNLVLVSIEFVARKAGEAFKALPEPLQDVAAIFATWGGIVVTIITVTRAVQGLVAAVRALELAEIGAWLFTPAGLAIMTGAAATMVLFNKQLTAAFTKIKEAVGLGGTDEKYDPNKLKRPDTEEIEKQITEAQNLWNEAARRRQEAEGAAIGGISYKWQQYFDKFKDNTKALALVQKGFELDIGTEVDRITNKVQKQTEELVSEGQKLIRERQAAALQVVPDETIAGRKQLAQQLAEIEVQQYQRTRDEKLKILEDELNKESNAALRSPLGPGGELARAQQIQAIYDKYIGYKTQLNANADNEIAAHRLRAEKQVNELIAEDTKQTIEHGLAVITRDIDARREYETQAAKARQSNEFNDRIRVVQQVRDIEERAITERARAEEKARTEQLAEYVRLHQGNQALIEEEARRATQDMVDISIQGEQEIQKARIEAWTEANNQIIEEQKKVYGQFKEGIGQIFDLLFDNSKSLGQRIADALKKTVLGAFKEIVSSNLAKQFTSALGYGTPEEIGRITREDRGGFLGIIDLMRSRPVTNIGPMPEITQRMPMGATATISFETSGATGTVDNAVSAVKDISQAQVQGAQAIVDTIQERDRQIEAITASGPPAAQAAVAPMVAASTLAMAPALAAAPTATGILGSLGLGLPGAPPEMGAATPGFMGGYPGGGGGGGGFLGSIFGSGGGRQGGMLGMLGRVFSRPYNPMGNVNMGDVLAQVTGGTAGPSAGGTAASRTTLFSGALKNIAQLFGQTSGQKFSLGGLLGSKGVAGLAGMAGMLGISTGLQKHLSPLTVLGGVGMGIGAASMLGFTALGGGLLGAGAGLFAAGVQKGGGAGLAMDIGGGALAGGMLGLRFGGPMGALIGAGIGAAAGAITGVVRMFVLTEQEKIRKQIKQVYGVDISNRQILTQIQQIIDQKYGKNVAVGIRSQDVQDLVRLYALSTGQAAGLPRPMYGVTATEQGGALSIQPVYQGGQLVQNPYTGPTTYQYQTAVTTALGVKQGQTGLGVPGSAGIVQNTFVQLNPQQANALLTGQIVQAVQQNPSAVASASATAARAGDSRLTTAAAMSEPLTALS